MIVKFVGRELSQRSLSCEYFGNAIAREMGLNTPKPHLLDIDEDIAGAINSDVRIRASGVVVPAGLAVGADWLRPALAPGQTARLTPSQAREAARIYAYDLMLQQPDRLVTNPNILEIRGHFVAIDFETSCSFLFAILPDPAPWRVSRLPYVDNHFFRRRLAPDSTDWRGMILEMLEVDLDRVDAAIDDLPPAWHDDCRRVTAHISTLRSRATDLVWEVVTSLSRVLT